MSAATMIESLRTWIAGRYAKAAQRGASAVEYGLLIAGIAAVVVVAVVALGPVIHDAFNKTCNAVDSQSAPTVSTSGTCK